MKKAVSSAVAAALAVSLAACGQAASSAPAAASAAASQAGNAVSAAASAASQAASSAAEGAVAAAVAAGDGLDPSVDYAALAGSTITVAASATPHAEILEDVVAPILATQDIKLDVQIFDDYVQPNVVVNDGEIYANYFQHSPYLDNFNAEYGSELLPVAKIHYEPYALYPGKTATLEELKDGAVIAVTNDPSNEARALQLLASAGLITLAPDAGLTATTLDIVENPKNIEILELEAAQIPARLADVDMAVINGNYAKEAGLTPAQNGVYVEDASSEMAQTYANIIAVKAGNEAADLTKALVAAATSQSVKAYIEARYPDGSVLTVY